MKTIFRASAVFLLVASFCAVGAQPPPAERTILCLVTLEHADAEQLASVLAAFLSSNGRIVPYAPTNTLIIRDRPSVVRMLLKVIKGSPDLAQCQNVGGIAPEEPDEDKNADN